MELNPYQPPDTKEGLTVADLHPVARNTCPVCLHDVRRWKLFWSSIAICSHCSTVLTLAMPHDNKPGFGCFAVALLCIAIVVFSLMPAIKPEMGSLYGLLLLPALFALYSLCLRWFAAFPYPRSLVVMGRIPASEPAVPDNLEDVG